MFIMFISLNIKMIKIIVYFDQIKILLKVKASNFEEKVIYLNDRRKWYTIIHFQQ